MILSELFEPVAQHKKEYFWTTTAIQRELAKHLKAKDVPNLRNISTTIKKLKWNKTKNNGIWGYYLKIKPASTGV